MVINFYLLADLALNCYISENKLLFAFKSTSIIEYASILPSLLTRLGAYQGNKFILLTRSLRYLLIHKLEPIFARRSMDVLKHVFRVLYAATSIMILGASFLMVVEVQQGFYIHDYLYFTVVTLSTVGFGDLYPQTDAGRICAIAIILTMISIIPKEVEELGNAMS